MKKCTLCVDRIYDEALPVEDRQPACVLTCPTHARFFGDLDDPDSEVSTLVRERGGESMMPELGYAPVNKYLPPRNRTPAPVVEKAAPLEGGTGGLLARWMHKQKEAFDKLGSGAGGPSSASRGASASAGHVTMRPGGVSGVTDSGTGGFDSGLAGGSDGGRPDAGTRDGAAS